MSHPLPWRDCPHPGYRWVETRWAGKDPPRYLAVGLQVARKRLDAARCAPGYLAASVTVCVACGMRWFRVVRLRRGEPAISPEEENP